MDDNQRLSLFARVFTLTLPSPLKGEELKGEGLQLQVSLSPSSSFLLPSREKEVEESCLASFSKTFSDSLGHLWDSNVWMVFGCHFLDNLREKQETFLPERFRTAAISYQ